MAKLTAKQQRFCDEYLIDLNATQAAIRAGYSENTARQQGQRLLTNVDIQNEISKRKNDRVERTEITQDLVLKELLAIAKVNATDYARIIEKPVMIESDGEMVQALDSDGNPMLYKTVDPILTEELTEEQKKAIAVIKKGRDGFEIKPYDKIKVLELLGRHLGMWTDKVENSIDISPIVIKDDVVK